MPRMNGGQINTVEDPKVQEKEKKKEVAQRVGRMRATANTSLSLLQAGDNDGGEP